MNAVRKPRKYVKSSSGRAPSVPPEPDNGERWTVIWDTKERPSTGNRNKAVERSEPEAIERARSFLNMGFFVYELRGPLGTILFDETGIQRQIGQRRTVKWSMRS